MSLYANLNRDAKRWWYHSELRNRGKHEEARALERKSIRDGLKTIRETLDTPDAYVTVGMGGIVLHTVGRTITHYSRELSSWAVVDYLVNARKVPCVNYLEGTAYSPSLPIPQVGRTENEPGEITSLTYVTVGTFLDMFVARGGVVINWPKEG